MLIVVYRKSKEDLIYTYSDILNKLYKYRDSIYIPSRCWYQNTTSFFSIEDIKVDFWWGHLERMSGLTFDYYNTDTGDASEFLAMRASRNEGKELHCIEDIIKVIEDRKEKSNKTNHSDVFKNTLVEQVKALGQEVIDQAENLVGNKDLYTNFEIKLIFPQKTNKFEPPSIEVKSTHFSRLVKERTLDGL